MLSLTISGGSHGKLIGEKSVQFCIPNKNNRKSHQHVISPYNINTLSTKMVKRVKPIILSMKSSKLAIRVLFFLLTARSLRRGDDGMQVGDVIVLR